MRRTVIMALVATGLLGGCAGYEVRDSNAAVDRNPACASRPDRPGEPLPRDCQRTTEASWSSDRGNSAPVDFSRKRGDD